MGDTRNYSMRIRSLIPTGDTLQMVCTSAPLASREGDCVLLGTIARHLSSRASRGDSKRKMVRMMSGSPMRAKWSRPPTAMLSLVLL